MTEQKVSGVEKLTLRQQAELSVLNLKLENFGGASCSLPAQARSLEEYIKGSSLNYKICVEAVRKRVNYLFELALKGNSEQYTNWALALGRAFNLQETK